MNSINIQKHHTIRLVLRWQSEQFTDLQNAMTTLNELDKRIARMCYDWSVNVDELNQLQVIQSLNLIQTILIFKFGFRRKL